LRKRDERDAVLLETQQLGIQLDHRQARTRQGNARQCRYRATTVERRPEAGPAACHGARTGVTDELGQVLANELRRFELQQLARSGVGSEQLRRAVDAYRRQRQVIERRLLE
jgi:hypothetical protein